MNWIKSLLPVIGFVALAGPAMADEKLVFGGDSATPGPAFVLAMMMAESGLSQLDYAAAEADFNDDGRLDVLAFAMNSYFCGSGGCGPRLYIANKKGWKEVPFYGLGAPDNWYLLDSSVNGFRKLAYLEDDDEFIFVFNGEYYDDAD
jgi:hypothetical protein